MAQQEYRIALSAPDFPLLSDHQSRTVIAPQKVEGAVRNNTPGLYYCHNVMPTKYGYVSVGPKEVIPEIIPAPGYAIVDVRNAFALGRTRMYFSWDSDGRAYDLEQGDVDWDTLADTTPSTVGQGLTKEDITHGTVNGVTYFWYYGIGCFVYDESAHALTSVTLSGIAVSDVLGITASSGYLIVYKQNGDIAWSSTIDPTDFVPSTVTGAGGGTVGAIGGHVEFVLPNALGILIYTDTNIVAGTYTGNAQYPFKFRQVDNSSGGINKDHVAYENTSQTQFAYTKAGLMAITSQKATTLLPEVTDFLSGYKVEDFDPDTLTMSITEVVGTMKKKLKLIASRYLVISYGATEFTHALIYDLSLEKLGKVKCTHVDCFEYIGAQSEIAKESIAFICSLGKIKVIDFSTLQTSSGVAILGKLEYSRGRISSIQGVEVEHIDTESELVVSDIYSYDGKVISGNVTGYLADSSDGYRKYNFNISAVNHSIVLYGQFDLTNVTVTYTVGGRR